MEMWYCEYYKYKHLPPVSLQKVWMIQWTVEDSADSVEWQDMEAVDVNLEGTFQLLNTRGP